MEFNTPYSPCFVSNCFAQVGCNQEWTREDDKLLEYALGLYDKDTPERWVRVASVFQTKTVFDVIKRYKKLQEDVSEIEARMVSFPSYRDSSFTLEIVGDQNYEGIKKSPSTVRSISQNQRKKNLRWTKEEHTCFLKGLLHCGKGNWRDIARKFVGTKTPSQVASHAQKYFIRQNLSKKGEDNKRRPSIHDITTLNINDTTTLDEDKSLPFKESSQMPSPHQNQTSIQNVDMEGIDNDYDDELLMKIFDDIDEDKSLPLQESPQMPSLNQNQTSIQNVQMEGIDNDYDDELLMKIFDNFDEDKSLPLQESPQMPSPHQNQTSTQNVQLEWIGDDCDDELLMKIFDPNNIDEDKSLPLQKSSQMPSPHQNQTSIPNVQLEWIDDGCNDELLMMIFDPNNIDEDKSLPLQESSQMPSPHHNQTSNQNLQLEWIDAMPQSPNFKTDFCDFNTDSFWEFP